MIKLRDQIPAEISRKFRLWHEKAMRSPAYVAAAKSVTASSGSCNRMLAARLNKLHRAFFP